MKLRLQPKKARVHAMQAQQVKGVLILAVRVVPSGERVQMELLTKRGVILMMLLQPTRTNVKVAIVERVIWMRS